MLRTKIVCTIGPASREPEVLRALMQAGMGVARLNFSHGDQAYHGENLRRIRQVAEEVGKPVAVLMDLQGPKLRVGQMPDEGAVLKEGEEVTLTTRRVTGRPGLIPVQYSRLPAAVSAGDRILLDDGLMELTVLESGPEEVRCRVVVGGVLESNKGINLPRASVSIPAITAKDRDDLRFALEQGADWIALSFVRTAQEVLELKELIREHGDEFPTPVIAKIEKPEAVDHIDDIIEAADAIMVARGDLGIEASPEEVPMMQKVIIRKCNQAGKPVITATQMLDSMIRNPRPTRAEASDVANAVLDGTDAIMLSGETAIGKYPLEAVRTMVKIAQQAEATSAGPFRPELALRPSPHTIAEAVAHATCQTARDLQAAAIVTPTVSGSTAGLIARYRPEMPIVAVTPSAAVQRRLMLTWGVYPLLARRVDNTDQMIADAVAAAREAGYVREGDLVVVTAGAAGYSPGTTNLMKVQRVV
jgi:pyruvate kinase